MQKRTSLSPPSRTDGFIGNHRSASGWMVPSLGLESPTDGWLARTSQPDGRRRRRCYFWSGGLARGRRALGLQARRAEPPPLCMTACRAGATAEPRPLATSARPRGAAVAETVDRKGWARGLQPPPDAGLPLPQATTALKQPAAGPVVWAREHDCLC